MMIEAVKKTLGFVKVVLILIYLCFAVLYILLVLPENRANFVAPLHLFFSLLMSLNIVLTVLACVEELLILSSLLVASNIILIITSYIIIDHNLTISLCLLVIFFMTFMLTLILYLKPKVLQNPENESANDDDEAQENHYEKTQRQQPLPLPMPLSQTQRQQHLSTLLCQQLLYSPDWGDRHQLSDLYGSDFQFKQKY